MGRIAPRRRRSSRVYQPVLHTWLNLRQRIVPPEAEQEPADNADEPPLSQPDTAEELETLETGPLTRAKQSLIHIWHMPDTFTWMEPLPYFHRRWVLIAGAVLLLALLWPYSDTKNGRYGPDDIDGPLSITHATLEDTTVPALLRQQRTSWQAYHIKPGQTLAQLFRANRLDINDVFALAQAEGDDKPLSKLKAGQEVRVQHNPQGQVTALELETTDNEHIYFRRQPDGNFLRIR